MLDVLHSPLQTLQVANLLENIKITNITTIFLCQIASYLGDPHVLEVPPLQREQLGPRYLVLQEGVAVHGEADALQPLGDLLGGPLEDDLDL